LTKRRACIVAAEGGELASPDACGIWCIQDISSFVIGCPMISWMTQPFVALTSS
jgi:hypothetical protein